MKNLTYLFKFYLLTLLTFFPEFALADSSTAMNFTPPPSDVSVTFLTNVFGMVDGVLYGGGSQILGEMFGVFNSAVLSIGGMILVYTIVVATINTAGEGKLLGKTWSSIWVPIRTTLGISCLFTYSSGYSVLQVLVMWIVLQGVGAADLVWNAALGYLQRGGVIVAPLMDATDSAEAGNYTIIGGAGYLTAGMSCMVALEQQLTTLQTYYTSSQSTVCSDINDYSYGTGSTEKDQMYTFCNNAIPDFLASVDFLELNDNKKASCTDANGTWLCGSDTPVVASMPNFTAGEVPAGYEGLNGICGQIQWNLMDESSIDSSADTLDMNDQETSDMSNSRVTALTQMYSDLTAVANNIAQNDLTLYNTGDACTSTTCYINSTYYKALSPLGVPAPTNGDLTGSPVCDRYSTCDTWITPKTGFAPVLNGTEYQGAVSDYNSLMSSTLNALNNSSTIAYNSSFIDDAESQGWIMAGSYFFDLAKLNYTSQSSSTDVDSGITGKYPSDLSAQFCSNSSGYSSSATDILCTWYAKGYPSTDTADQATYGNQIAVLMTGTIDGAALDDNSSAVSPDYGDSKWPDIYIAESSSTVYGYADNASNTTIEDQQGQIAPDSFDTGLEAFDIKPPKVSSPDCNFHTWWEGGVQSLCNALNNRVVDFINGVLDIIFEAISAILNLVITYPVSVFKQLFNVAAGMMDNTVNAIVSLMAMGNLFINVTMTLMITLSVGLALSAATFFPLGVLIPILMIFGPLLMAWIGGVLALGVMLAYYVPLLPYLLYTFAGFGWLISVLEAMVAAPLVALGISLPEGEHDVFGKGVHALMLILNAFLRPTLIVIGYIAAIILSTVGIWMINTGFEHFQNAYLSLNIISSWAYLYVGFFLFTAYVTMCVGVVNDAFDLIYQLPEKVLRWIGGQGASGGLGSETGKSAGAELKKSNEAGAQSMEKGASANRSTGGGSKGSDKKPNKEEDGGGEKTGGSDNKDGDTEIHAGDSTQS